MSAHESITARLLFALSGHSRSGLRLKQLADAIGESSPTTSRALARMAIDGLASRTPDDKDFWHLDPRIVQIAIAHQAELAREEQKLADFRNRYSRLPD